MTDDHMTWFREARFGMFLTGIDYYEHPRLCRLRMQELYPQL